jgi:hypothetical protein
MLDFDLTRLLAAKGGRPLSVLIALSAIVLPSSLLVYFTRPDLYKTYGIAGGIFFGATVGLPVVFACCWPWHAVFQAGVQQEEITRRIAEAFGTASPRPQLTVVETVTAEDPLEWPVLLIGGSTANIVLYCLVAVAYYHPFRLGSTLLLTVVILLAVWVVLVVWLRVALKRLERSTQAAIDNARKGAPPVRPGA